MADFSTYKPTLGGRNYPSKFNAAMDELDARFNTAANFLGTLAVAGAVTLASTLAAGATTITGAVTASGTINANNVASNIRLKANGTTAKDAILSVTSTGIIAIGHWDGTGNLLMQTAGNRWQIGLFGQVDDGVNALQVGGGISTNNTGGTLVQRATNAGITLSGGVNALSDGASIQMFGSTHATQASNSFYNGTTHTFRTMVGGNGGANALVKIGGNLQFTGATSGNASDFWDGLAGSGTTRYINAPTGGGVTIGVNNADKLAVTAASATVTGALNCTGIATLSSGAGNKRVIIGGSPSANDGGSIEFLSANASYNWAIRTNWTTGSALEFQPSTASGGSTFATPTYIFTQAGTVQLGNAQVSNATLNINSNSSTAAYLYFNGAGVTANNTGIVGNAGAISNVSFVTSGAEAGRFTDQKFFKASNYSTYFSSAGTFHEFVSNVASSSLMTITHSDATQPFGIQIRFIADPNGTTNQPIWFDANGTRRFEVRSNGGVANFSANNVNLSTRAVKYDIRRYTDDDLKRYEAFLEDVDFCKWKYQDQTHADYNHGPTVEGVRWACQKHGMEEEEQSLIDVFSGDYEGLIPEDLKNIALVSLIASNKRMRQRLERAGIPV